MSKFVRKAEKAEVMDLISTGLYDEIGEREQDVIARFVENSTHMWASFQNDKMLGLCGLIPSTLLSDSAYLWLQHTRHAEDNTFIFIRHSQLVVAEALREFRTLRGHCVVGQEKSIRWVGWLGAKFGQPKDNLIPFTIERKEQ